METKWARTNEAQQYVAKGNSCSIARGQLSRQSETYTIDRREGRGGGEHAWKKRKCWFRPRIDWYAFGGKEIHIV